MSAFAMNLLQGKRPVIYGTGEKRRDFVYVEDVTEFNLLALRDPRTDGQVYDVGSGINYSVNEVFALMEEFLGTGLRPVYQDDLAGEAETTLADVGPAQELSWKPRVPVGEGIERSIAYIKEHVLDESRSAGRR
jgi:UDP-glucose 4-epimerase